MGVLPVDKAREAAARAYEELQIPVGSPPELVVSTFRTLCLQHAFHLGDPAASASDKKKKDQTKNNQSDSNDLFQRQAVAYRFLRSLPLLENTEYRSDAILAKLRPLEEPHSHKLSGDRASAMLDVSISTLEHAQRRWQLPYINYVITVHYCLRKHVVRRRYSEFQALHDVLQRRLPVIPALPARSWLLKLRVPLERAQSLAQYLVRVITILSMRGVFSQEIMAFLEIDFARVRAEEETFALEFLSRAADTGGSSDRQRLFYLVSTMWLSEWKRFITDPSHHAPPGPITNRKLLKGDEVLVPVLGRDYRCLNFVSWQYVSQIYGGGPRIVRSVPAIQGDDAVDSHTIALILQRLARGFLGRRAAQRRRLYMLRQDPVFEKRLETLQKHACLDACMETVRKFVSAREFQIRHVASIKIQRAFRRFLLRVEHKLLLAESAVPAVGENFQHVEEYFSLEEIGLIRDASYRLAHFLVTMNKGVPIQKLRSRRKTPQWRLFRIDAIGSQLLWSSKKSDHALAFCDVTTLVVESPLLLKSGLGRRRSMTYDHAVVLSYKDAKATTTKDTNKTTGETRELILICESQCDCNALLFGLNALLTETRNRTAHGATYVDGHGVIRKKLPHAKRLIHDAQQLIDAQLHNPFRLNQQHNPFL